MKEGCIPQQVWKKPVLRREFRKAENISKGALSSLLESRQTHYFFDSLQNPSGARRELCCC